MSAYASRIFRCHFGGEWNVINVAGGELYSYSGGEYADSGVIQQDTANWLDFDDWLRSVDPRYTLDVITFGYWLDCGFKRSIDSSEEFDEMWEHNYTDDEGLTHVYVESFEPAKKDKLPIKRKRSMTQTETSAAPLGVRPKTKTLGVRPNKVVPIKKFKSVVQQDKEISIGESLVINHLNVSGNEGVDAAASEGPQQLDSGGQIEEVEVVDGAFPNADEGVNRVNPVNGIDPQPSIGAQIEELEVVDGEQTVSGVEFNGVDPVNAADPVNEADPTNDAEEDNGHQGLGQDTLDLHGFRINLDSIDDEDDYVSDHSSLEGEDLEPEIPCEEEHVHEVNPGSEGVHDGEPNTEGVQDGEITNNDDDVIEMGQEELNLIENTFTVDDDADEVPGTERVLEGLYIHQRWQTVHEVRKFLRTYAIENHFAYRYVKNEPSRITAVCKDPECNWRVHISVTNDKRTMRLKTLVNIHSCILEEEDKNPMAMAPWIAEKIEEAMRIHHRSFTPNEIVDYMWLNHQLDLKYWQAWHSRVLALEKLHGNFDESFRKVPELCRQILASNPGSICTFSRDDTYNTFTGMCLSFKASLDGFVNGCRPLLGLDGCFLKGKYGGVILSIIALDGNNGMFPVAVYICGGEDQYTWDTFLRIMAPRLLRHPLPLCIMSDRQKGLDDAVQEVFPGCIQRFCFRHMVKNLHRKWRGVDDLVWAAAKAHKKTDHERAMRDLQLAEPQAKAWLDGEDTSLWARSHFDHTTKSDHTTNNFTEAFNSYILSARDKPIVVMVAKIQTMLMRLIHTRRQVSSGWSDTKLVPKVEAIIQKMCKKKNDYIVGGSNEHNFQVTHYAGRWWEVNIQNKTCTCNQWQLTGYPCIHAVCVIAPRRLPWHEYCSPYFTGEYYKRCYSGFIRPMLHEHDWEEPMTRVLPPLRRRAPGRPRVRRIRGEDEGRENGRNQNLCGSCRIYGHNARSCQGGAVDGNVILPGGAVMNRGGARGGGPVNRGGRPRTRAPRPIIVVPLAEANAVRGRGSRRGRGRGSRGGRGGRGSVEDENAPPLQQGSRRRRGSRGGRGSVEDENAPPPQQPPSATTTPRARGRPRGSGVNSSQGTSSSATVPTPSQPSATKTTQGATTTTPRARGRPRGSGVNSSQGASSSATVPTPSHSRQSIATPYMRPPQHPRSQVFNPPTARVSARLSHLSQTSSQASNDGI